MKIKLNITGKEIKRVLTSYLKEIDQYHKLEDKLILESTARSYQDYITHLELAESAIGDIAAFKLYHNLSNRFYVNYVNNLKMMGVGPVQRKKLALDQSDDDEGPNILQDIANALS